VRHSLPNSSGDADDGRARNAGDGVAPGDAPEGWGSEELTIARTTPTRSATPDSALPQLIDRLAAESDPGQSARHIVPEVVDRVMERAAVVPHHEVPELPSDADR